MEVADTGSSDTKAGMVRVTCFSRTVYLHKTLSPLVDLFSHISFAGLTVADLVFPW